jgi:hypothetical protein
MSTSGRGLGPSIRTEGGLLPADLLARVAANDPQVPGLTLAAFHLDAGLRFGEAITRSWNRLIGSWAAFQAERAALPSGDPGTTVTRERWLLPLFDELGYGRLQRTTAVDVEGKTYPVSHAWNAVPIHLVGCRVALDRRTERVAGAAGQAPHGLVQELLNRSPERLWGFVSNGLTLRVLRDNATLTRQAYIEFDLEAIFDGEAYAEFALLWLVAHQSRVEGEQPETCWLEQWTTFAAEAGTRALDKLRAGVETAISTLGSGFLGHPANGELRDALRDGALDKQDYYRELLRLVYRLLFLFTAEDRGLLLDPDADEPARRRYFDYYSTARLRRLAERRKGSRHADLWAGLRVVLAALSSDTGAPGLGLPALGGFLFSDHACPRLDRAEIANRDLLDAVRALATIEDGRVRRSVDYRNLGAEELGGVYESLLELHPELDANAGTFALTTAGGHERKTTGSYYTPTSLINVLLDSALDPVLAEAEANTDPAAAILRLAVVDPAAGSGHFLVAAAHRIAKRLATVRTREQEPSPAAVRTALRDVIGKCIYAVDANPMAVELCKVSLWLEAIEPGKPLSFLDAHIKCGNSLFGTTPEAVAAGVPDAAYDPIIGDDKPVARDLKKRNRAEREGQLTFDEQPIPNRTADLAAATRALDEVPDGAINGVRAKASQFDELLHSPTYREAKGLADMWCSAFMSRKTAEVPPITTSTLRLFARDVDLAPLDSVSETARQAADYGFFHWPIEFPRVFSEGGGFDVVLGNPPWEKIQFEEQQFFAERNPQIANARNAAQRKRLIVALREDNPAMWRDFQSALRKAAGESHFVRDAGAFPLTGLGRINTYALFAEKMRALLALRGRAGIVVPMGIATDDTTKYFFGDIVDAGSLVCIYSFENEEFVFPAVHHAYRFSLLTMSGPGNRTEAVDLVFYARQTSWLLDAERHFTLSPADLALLNPNTRTCPTFRSKRDAEIAKAVYRRVPVLIREADPRVNPWAISFMQGLFNMASDSSLFRDEPGPTRLPLYEAKLLHQFTHRWATYGADEARDMTIDELRDPDRSVTPRYWVDRDEVEGRLEERWPHEWLLAFRDVTGAEKVRTVIASVIPRVGVGHSAPILVSDHPFLALLVANLNSFALDWQARQKVGGIHLTFGLFEQLPVIPPETYLAALPWSAESLAQWLRPYVVELIYTATDVRPFATDLGWSGPPFTWDAPRRAQARAELDAAFFHLYGLGRDDVEHIMESFWIVRNRDEREHGTYRTKELILEAYDAMAAASHERPFASRLIPGPGDPAAAHPSTHPEPKGRWIPWADIERASPTLHGRSVRPVKSAVAAPVIVFPEQDASPEVRYPEAPPARRRVAESKALATPLHPSQSTLVDLTRASTASGTWLPEEVVDVTAVFPGRRVRHRRFGEGVVIEIRRSVTPATVTIRFGDTDDRDIAIGYGLIEFAAE